MKMQLRSSAKVNLSLDILSRREDGYHELASVVHTIGIWDRIELEVVESGSITFTCNREDLAGDDNLCVKTIHLWNKVQGTSLGASIHLEKIIPTGAGLGGGSGNAAAILIGLNKTTNGGLSEAELGEIGAKLGADVPLFVRGGAVLMEGIGEILSPLPRQKGWLTIIKPNESYSTPAIYKAWDGNGFESVKGSAKMKGAVLATDLNTLARELSNDLERAATQLSATPVRLVQMLKTAGAIGAQMSGSGSACFGIFAEEKAAQGAARQLEGELAKDVHLQSSQLFVAPFCSCGVEVAP